MSDTVESEAKPLCLARRRLLVTQQSVHVGAKHSFHKRVLNIFSKKKKQKKAHNVAPAVQQLN